MRAALKAHLGRIKRLHWHHHVIRGALVAHSVHGITILRTEYNYNGAIDIACLFFVIVEYVLHDRELTKQEREKEVATVHAD